jgi:site-specific DNA-adenine methylase
MIRVIAQREYDLGNYTLNGMNYKLNKDWKDIVQAYKNDSNAFIYLDPPYETTDSINITKASKDGEYYGKINLNELILFLNECKCKWMLSFTLNKELMKRMKGFNIKTYTTRKL